MAIVTNGGGPGILCADACEASGLRVPPLDTLTQRALAASLPPEASCGNPVDLIASAGADDYERALGLVLADTGVDAVIAIFVRPLATRAADVARAIASAAETPAAAGKPMLAVFMGADKPPPLAPAGPGVPRFPTPEEAARALGHVVRHARRRRTPPDPPPELAGVDADRAAAIIAQALGAGGGWLEPPSVESLLSSFGLPLARSIVATFPGTQDAQQSSSAAA